MSPVRKFDGVQADRFHRLQSGVDIGIVEPVRRFGFGGVPRVERHRVWIGRPGEVQRAKKRLAVMLPVGDTRTLRTQDFNGRPAFFRVEGSQRRTD